MSNLSTLKLTKGNEFKIRVEDISEFSGSFFRDIYVSAANSVEDIVFNTKLYHSQNEVNCTDTYNKSLEEYNNIIAFIGDRGAGKSSGMVSFSEALRKLKYEDTKKNIEWFGIRQFANLSNYEFECLDIIDPSLFECNESIFEVIIAKMFSKFKKCYEDNDKNIDVNNKKRVLKSFQRVYTDLKTINSERQELYNKDVQSENVIETLEMLASGSNMRKNFITLVQECLNLFTKNNNDKSKSFLVISIDDLDMNIKHAAIMAEQIRKYLLVPNVIILMAVKLEQLSNSLEQAYRDNFDQKLVNNNTDPKEMATKYLEKLIPNGRKLFLPQIKAFGDGKGDVIELEVLIGDDHGVPKYLYQQIIDDEGIARFPSIQETVLRLTYEKTGLIFLKPEYSSSYLVPNSLRELHNFLSMLMDLPDSKHEESNLAKFEDYFLNTWVRNNLPQQFIDIIDTFYATNIELKNKFIIKSIYQIINRKISVLNKVSISKTDEINKSSVESLNLYISKISPNTRNPLNISLGNVLSALKLWSDYDDSENARKLSFAIKTIYSIVLYRLINIEAYSINNIMDTKIKENKQKINYENICSITGGDLWGELASQFIRNGRGVVPFIGYNLIQFNNSMMGDIVEKIFKNIINIQDDYSVLTGNDELFEDVRLTLVEWLHYFIYIGLTGKVKPFEEEEIVYTNEAKFTYKDSGSVGGVSNATFNVAAFIFFLLNPDGNIERVFSRSIDIFLNKQESIPKITDIENYLMSAIRRNSLSKRINEWSNKFKLIYPLAIPIYSIDFLEMIYLNIRKVKNNKVKKGLNNDYFSYFKIYLENFIKVIEMISDNHLYLRHQANGNVYKFEEIFKQCPVVDMTLDSSRYGINELEISKLLGFIDKNPKDPNELETDQDLLTYYFNNFSFNHMSNINNMITKVRDIIKNLKNPKSAPIKEALSLTLINI